ncbi:PTS IIA-like nitrogen regulatory protein PtsN [Terrarubrum flagellatum]|uniref:PTS IIA-like nitrogen regulatory protein PtsN n=1 Tax=Terrirubrum flagellatum TaxID=2895980 RepID=UPI00314566CF
MLNDLLSPQAVVPQLKAANKKQAIQQIAAQAAELWSLPEREVFESLLQRERLGSTGIGNGIAIPHGKLPVVVRPVGLFARLEKPIDFEAVDGEPVDLMFLLLAPEEAGADHLKALARVARVLRDATVTAQLRSTRDAAALHALLTQQATPHAA